MVICDLGVLLRGGKFKVLLLFHVAPPLKLFNLNVLINSVPQMPSKGSFCKQPKVRELVMAKSRFVSRWFGSRACACNHYTALPPSRIREDTLGIGTNVLKMEEGQKQVASEKMGVKNFKRNRVIINVK